jgi:hypothetical protein
VRQKTTKNTQLFVSQSIDEQYFILKPLNILPYKYRILFRFSPFCFKILNNIILKDFFSDLKPNLNVKNTRCTFFLGRHNA